MSAIPKGLYRKFNVNRVDGRDRPGGDRAGAEYLVLDLTYCPFAAKAALAYANALKAEYPHLAADIRAKVRQAKKAKASAPPTPEMAERVWWVEDPELGAFDGPVYEVHHESYPVAFVYLTELGHVTTVLSRERVHEQLQVTLGRSDRVQFKVQGMDFKDAREAVKLLVKQTGHAIVVWRQVAPNFVRIAALGLSALWVPPEVQTPAPWYLEPET